uniref:Tetratricopeptide repeat protein n=1 Tax=candidate division WOR-3 bacterium TaxID=2052148 RepID=A0A7C3N5P9_UNCW3
MEPDKEKILEAGYFYFQNQKFKKAIKIFEKGLSMFPNDIDIYYNLGIVYESINEIEKAKECFKKVLEIDRDNTDAKKHLEKLVNI